MRKSWCENCNTKIQRHVGMLYLIWVGGAFSFVRGSVIALLRGTGKRTWQSHPVVTYSTT